MCTRTLPLQVTWRSLPARWPSTPPFPLTTLTASFSFCPKPCFSIHGRLLFAYVVPVPVSACDLSLQHLTSAQWVVMSTSQLILALVCCLVSCTSAHSALLTLLGVPASSMSERFDIDRGETIAVYVQCSQSQHALHRPIPAITDKIENDAPSSADGPSFHQRFVARYSYPTVVLIRCRLLALLCRQSVHHCLHHGQQSVELVGVSSCELLVAPLTVLYQRVERVVECAVHGW